MIALRIQVIANSSATLLARVRAPDGTNLTNAAVTSITANSYNLDTGVLTAAIPSGDITVYDALQTDGRWNTSLDPLGFNLAIAAPGSAWPTCGRFQLELKVTPTSGNPFLIVWDADALRTFTS